ncbi:uncharacterized protein B0J16DRAFT_331878 [Fusarium flagelliforme]|uniref:uncharacterized protein n=1 Tax=Fusarium flagelliforme TaxID=2675880 RepID=UPI001E8EB8FB|nr:uncharacterized protein B0J16DRAFT_331878 [Fusarium flagelliforme]KAH7191869.1 hypothetical protein B0J16DRAFT_331878 [Fusarium flagelliforme]
MGGFVLLFLVVIEWWLSCWRLLIGGEVALLARLLCWCCVGYRVLLCWLRYVRGDGTGGGMVAKYRSSTI